VRKFASGDLKSLNPIVHDMVTDPEVRRHC
jgi:hypothetical protein